MHFRVFFKVKLQNGGIFLGGWGGSKNSNMFIGCLNS